MSAVTRICGRWGVICLRLLVVTGALGFAPRAFSAPPVATTEAVYAAFTLNLTRFITWPESALGPTGSPFVIGTFPRDPINAELDAAVQGESVGSHPVHTIRLRSLNDVQKCQIVFVSHGTADPDAVVQRAERRPILTISDMDGFLALGGHVRFVPQPPHTKLQISANNLRASGLEARAQLLRLAATP
jgi:hypothetical protein